MRWAIAHPCIGSRAITLRISRSRVPCTRSVGLLMSTPLSYRQEFTRSLVGKQGETGNSQNRASPRFRRPPPWYYPPTRDGQLLIAPHIVGNRKDRHETRHPLRHADLDVVRPRDVEEAAAAAHSQ